LSLTSKSETINLAKRYDLLHFPKDDVSIKLTINISFTKAKATLIKAPFNGLSKKSGGSKAPSASDVAVRKALLRIRE
jgi:hypothetical protein